MHSCPNLEQVCCPMSSSKCCFLTCIQISQEAGKVVCYPHLFKNFPQFVVTYTVKDFSIVNEANVFLESPCFFYDPMYVGNLISGSSAFSKSSLNICKFTVHVLLKPDLENFEHYLANMWDMGQQYPAAGIGALGAATWECHNLWHKPSWRRLPFTPS